MTKLEKLYSIIENSRDLGVRLNKDVLQQVEEMEEGIIKEEILPALSNDIAPRLEPIKRDLVLVVEYHPNEPISVALSRKAKISEMTGAKVLTPRNSTPVRSEEEPEETQPHEPTKHIENVTKGMKVTFPDGTIIWHRQAIDTFINALREIGLERIATLNIQHGGGYNLVSKDKRPTQPGRIWQHECDGWYIYSNISNSQKVEDLQIISDYYHLNLIIEEGKPSLETKKAYRTPVIDEVASSWDYSMKDQFRNFLTRQKSESTANSYTSTLDHSVRGWIRKEVDEHADSVFSYTSAEDVRLCIEMLNASPKYVVENDRKHHSMSAALNQYLAFIEYWEKRYKG
ncbi:MAG: hypothetical protein IJ693_03330 [Bacteroidaceae bacterium]|nr:hypothetical protein [Bacteroidaceae bacterium]